MQRMIETFHGKRRTCHSRFSRIAFVVVLLFAGCNEPIATRRDLEDDDPEPVAIVIPMTVKVMKVIDGDTIFGVNRSQQSVTVQLRGVDAPELAQSFGQQSRDLLFERVDGKTVRLELAEEDEFGRKTAEVFDGESSINVWVIEQGMAWHNWKFDSDQAKAAAEKKARESKIGLWSETDPQPPWEWKNPPDDGKLYVQGNGTRYHKASCRTLDARRKEISFEDAVKTKVPCKVCHPPTEE